MNILILTYQGDIAGSTYSISYLAKGLVGIGHHVVVGCRTESLLYGLLEGTGVQLEAMTFKSKVDGQNMLHIKKVVEQHNIQVINAQSSKDRYTASLARWRYKLPVVVVHTRRQQPMSSGGQLQSWFYMWATDKIVAVSNGVKLGLMKLGISEQHIKVIHNGTPAEKYILPGFEERASGIRRALQIPEGSLVVGCIARKKQQGQLLEALKHISKPIHLVLIGVEPCEEYQTIINGYQPPHRVHILGTVAPAEAIYYYSIFSVKVLPSISEGLSQSLLEAMALGVPVVATRAAGNPDLITDGENGLMFNEGDTVTLARAIERLLYDQELRQKIIANGHHTAKVTFSIEKVVANYAAFFKELLQKKGFLAT